MVAAIKKEKLIENSKYPVLARLVVSSMLKIEEEKKLPHYIRLGTCMNRGVSLRKIQPVIDNVIEEVMYSVVGNSYDNLPDKSLQQQFKTYLNTAT